MARPSIRAQAYLVGVLPLIFLVALLAISLLMAQNSRAGGVIEQRTTAIIALVDRIRGTITDAGRSATPGTRISPAAIRADRVSVDADFRSLNRLVADQPDVVPRVQDYQRVSTLGIDLIARFAEAVQSGNAGAARDIANAASTRALSDRIARDYEAVISHERAHELASINTLRNAQRRDEIALIALCVLAIVLTLLVSGRFGLGLARRLEHLAENARRLARGEAAEQMRGDDEFTDLDRVYQEMMLRIAREKSISSELQQRLLPQELPNFPGIRVDTAYVPAREETEVGGDWYDVFPIGDRRLCISMGDVAGHGLRAATIMASARLAVRTAARIESDPAAIMTHVNRVLCADEPGTLVTACVATLDLDDGTLRYATAGHPEPIVIGADRDVDLLHGRGMLLGADPRAAYESYELRLTEGSALMLYTDGLVEIEHDYLAGVRELCEAAAEEYTRSSENIAEAIQQRVFHGRRASDDAALLFLGVTKLGAPRVSNQRTWSFDACDPKSAHRARRAMLWFLGNHIRDEADLAGAELVLGELMGNVARHSPGPADVTVDRRDGLLYLRVTDRGAPFTLNGKVTDLYAESGRGLFLVRSIAKDVRVGHNGTGNEVTAVIGVS